MSRIFVAAIALLPCMAFDQNNTPYTNFTNPSFECGIQKESIFPDNWSSTTPNNTPDILPGAWGLEKAAHHGKTCLGLVTREDGSSENLGQELPKALHKGDCYAFSVFLSHANYYVKYDKPCRIKVWGGSKPGERQVLLATSPLVSHTDWKQYEFKFTATQDCKAITFEAAYAPGVSQKYKGNIILDQCSEIIKCEKA
jgi:hypothetical protein